MVSSGEYGDFGGCSGVGVGFVGRDAEVGVSGADGADGWWEGVCCVWLCESLSVTVGAGFVCGGLDLRFELCWVDWFGVPFVASSCS